MTEKPTDENPHAPLAEGEAEERVKLAHERQQESAIFSDRAGKIGSSRITRQHDGDATSYSNYLFGAAGSADKPLWSDTFKGRATIRFFSRFVVGSALMTMVDRSMRGKLRNYDLKNFSWNEGNAYTRIAYSFDKTFGRGIQKIVKIAGGTEEQVNNSVRFRHKAYYHDEVGRTAGRSLGEEMTGVTASFAAGSFGDAATRNLIQVFDPNSMKVWMVNDKGEAAKPGEKKHFNFEKWLSSTVRTSWRVVSKNMGEDWAVALPYVYQMRWQRNLLSGGFGKSGKGKSPDLKLNLDYHMGGASMHIDKSGNLLGNFEPSGALDLQARFVGYNWYTLMYRETYDAIGRQFSKWADSGFSLKPHLPSNPIEGTLHAAGYGARYVLKSFIKSNLYMQPAVPFFWAPRIAANRIRAGVIMAEQFPRDNAIGSQLSHQNYVQEYHKRWGNSRLSPQDFENTMYQETKLANGDVGYRHLYNSTEFMVAQDPGLHGRMGYKQTDTINYGNNIRMQLDQHGWGRLMQKPGGMYSADYIRELWKVNKPQAIFSAAITPFGWVSYKAGSAFTTLANHLPEAGALSMWLSQVPQGSKMPGRVARENFTRDYFGNAFSYTPYMIAKAETALRVDERPADGGLGEMDKAIYKFIDSSVRFDMGGTGKAIKDIWHHGTNMNRAVKMREGGEGDALAAKSVLAPEDRPQTRVVKPVVKHHDPVHLETAHEGMMPDEKSWAESVTGRELAGRFQHSPQSIN